ERELAILSRQAVQMTRLVDDLMNVARISQGKLDLRLDAVELVQALRFVAEEAAPAIQAAGQSLRVSLPEAPMWGRLDHARVTQIVANLLNNASKYSPAGAHLALTATREEGGQGGPDVAVIEVSDDGIGIAPDQLGRIFDMFSQLTPAMERAQGGLGIGLSLVKGLVELHGGQVAAHSDGPGKGSRFTVRMPLAAPLAPVAATARAPARATPGERAHVVLVDDNHDAAETLAAALDMLGYRVSVCHSAHEALAAMAQAPPRAAVLDIGLPDLNGYELARRIRGTPWGAGIVLVAATGWGQDTDKQAAREAGFDAHFTKPLDFISLDRELKSLLERR
ncbi:MAG: ATP-binding protein, partial [Massilia sp.]